MTGFPCRQNDEFDMSGQQVHYRLTKLKAIRSDQFTQEEMDAIRLFYKNGFKRGIRVDRGVTESSFSCFCLIKSCCHPLKNRRKLLVI